jgi:hypothetical protein
MAMRAPDGVAIVIGLRRAADEARKRGHALETAVILFQSVEGLVRIWVKLGGQRNRLSRDTLKRCTAGGLLLGPALFYLSMLDPENELLEDLKQLNSQRNRLIHKLFSEFRSVPRLREEAEQFCDLAERLREDLLDSLTKPFPPDSPHWDPSSDDT